MGQEWRAEAIIAEIYRQKQALIAGGHSPSRVRLPLVWIRRIRLYRLLLGPLAMADNDYLQHDSIFGLDFVLDQAEMVVVE